MGDSGSPGLVKCVSCGMFLLASVDEGRKIPTRNSCIECGGTEFEDPAGD